MITENTEMVQNEKVKTQELSLRNLEKVLFISKQ